MNLNAIDWQNIFYLTSSLVMIGLFGLIILIYMIIYQVYQLVKNAKKSTEQTLQLIKDLKKNFKLTIINLLLNIFKERSQKA